jgi:hypothetical protein
MFHECPNTAALLEGTVRRIFAFIFAALILLALGYAAEAEEIPLQAENGVLIVRGVVNARVALRFTIDSASTDVSIPDELFWSLVRAGTIATQDIIDTQSYRLADGSQQYSKRFRIRSLRVGDTEIRDVIGSVAPAKGDLLLGQSFLSKLGSWSIDNERRVLLLNESPNGARPVHAASGARVETATTVGVEPSNHLLSDTLAYLLTGSELAKVRIVDRAKCIVELRSRAWPEAPDLVSIVHLNNVDLDQSGIQVTSDVPKNRVDITLRGESVVDYLARPAFKLGQHEFPDKPAHSASEDVITLYTDESARILRAWDYVFSHGCTGSNVIAERSVHR